MKKKRKAKKKKPKDGFKVKNRLFTTTDMQNMAIDEVQELNQSFTTDFGNSELDVGKKSAKKSFTKLYMNLKTFQEDHNIQNSPFRVNKVDLD